MVWRLPTRRPEWPPQPERLPYKGVGLGHVQAAGVAGVGDAGHGLDVVGAGCGAGADPGAARADARELQRYVGTRVAPGAYRSQAQAARVDRSTAARIPGRG